MLEEPRRRCPGARALEQIALRGPDEQHGIAEHARICRTCGARVEELRRAVDALRALEPPDEAEEVRAARIASICAGQGHSHSAHRVPKLMRSGFGRYVFAVAGAAAAVLLWALVPSPRQDAGLPFAPFPLLAAGELIVEGEAIPWGPVDVKRSVISVGDDGATLVWPDGSVLVAAADTQLSVVRVNPVRVALERGLVDLFVEPQRPGAALQVTTAELSATVVGTVFSIERRDTALGSRTIVRVMEGIVEVTPARDGVPFRLAAGELVERESNDDRNGGAPQASISTPAPARVRGGPLRSEASPGAKAASAVARVGRDMEAGDAEAAREAAAAAHAEAALDEAQEAELALLEAEIELRARRHAAAAQRYLEVARLYAGTSQGDAALFAAARIACEHGDAGYDGIPLLERYLATYADGRFAPEARLLLAAMRRQRP